MPGNAARRRAITGGSAFSNVEFAAGDLLRSEASLESGLVSSGPAAERETGGLNFDGNCWRGIVLTGNAPLPNAAPMSLLRFEPGVGHDGKLRRSILIWVGRSLPGVAEIKLLGSRHHDYIGIPLIAQEFQTSTTVDRFSRLCCRGTNLYTLAEIMRPDCSVLAPQHSAVTGIHVF